VKFRIINYLKSPDDSKFTASIEIVDNDGHAVYQCHVDVPTDRAMTQQEIEEYIRYSAEKRYDRYLRTIARAGKISEDKVGALVGKTFDLRKGGNHGQKTEN